MGIERNGRQRRFIARETLYEYIEEEQVWVWDGEEEVPCPLYGLEVSKLVGEFGDNGKVVLEAVDNDFSVGLAELRKRGGAFE